MKTGTGLSLVVAVSGFAASIAWAGQAEQFQMTILRDLAYVPNGHERQKLDLYLPNEAGPCGTKWPLLVWIHGGAWLGGSKERPAALLFVARGYAVASINYRLSQHAIFPAQIEDCKAALRWLRVQRRQVRLRSEPHRRLGRVGRRASGCPAGHDR